MPTPILNPLRTGQGTSAQILFWKKQASGPTPLRQIRTQHRKHEQPKNRQGQNHHHHGATLQTPLYSASRWPIIPSSFSTTWLAVPGASAAPTPQSCHPTPTLCTPVLEPLSHYPLVPHLLNAVILSAFEKDARRTSTSTQILHRALWFWLFSATSACPERSRRARRPQRPLR